MRLVELRADSRQQSTLPSLNKLSYIVYIADAGGFFCPFHHVASPRSSSYSYIPPPLTVLSKSIPPLRSDWNGDDAAAFLVSLGNRYINIFRLLIPFINRHSSIIICCCCCRLAYCSCNSSIGYILMHIVM